MRQRGGNKHSGLMTASRLFAGLFSCLVVIACAARISSAQATKASRPAYAPERYDEDWSFLRDPSKRTDFFDAIKWIPLDKDGSLFLTVGGELRERFQDVRNQGFGLPSPTHDANGYHRIFLFADIHLGPHFRAFAELVNGEIMGALVNPSPTEKDPLDVLQGFADVILPITNHGAFTIRIGRHEMTFGSGRFISFRDTPNLRREFDGVRTFWTNGKGKRLDALLVRPSCSGASTAPVRLRPVKVSVLVSTSITWGSTGRMPASHRDGPGSGGTRLEPDFSETEPDSIGTRPATSIALAGRTMISRLTGTSKEPSSSVLSQRLGSAGG